MRKGHDRFMFAALLLFALVVRLAVWSWLRGPIIGGDSGEYLAWSRMLASGDLSPVGEYPLHLFYPLLLTPIYLFGIPQPLYIFLLHLTASVATVGLCYRAGEILRSRRYGLVVGTLVAIYPSILTWFPWVLTETVFLFVVAAFLVVFLELLSHPSLGRIAVYVVASLVLAFSRPVGPPLVAVSAAIFLSYIVARRRGWRAAMSTVAMLAVAALALGGLALAARPDVRARVLRVPSVAQSLWLSARVSSSNIDELEAFMAPDLPPNTPEKEMWAYKVGYAKSFVLQHPLEYVGMAARRFTSFWYPWAFARWSLPHRLLDATLSLALTAGALAALWRRDARNSHLAAVLLLALSLGLITAFSQIDSDGRYRVPAELVLLVAAPLGFGVAWRPMRLLRAAKAG